MSLPSDSDGSSSTTTESSSSTNPSESQSTSSEGSPSGGSDKRSPASDSSSSTSLPGAQRHVKKDIVELSIEWFKNLCLTIWEMWLTTYRMLCLMYTYPNAARHATWIAYKAIMISYKYDLWSLIGVYAITNKEKPKPPPKPKTIVVKPAESGWLARIGLTLPEKGPFASSKNSASSWTMDGIMYYLKSGTEKKTPEAINGRK